DLGQSTIVAVGSKPGGSPWRIGVVDPARPENYFAVVELEDMAMGTSQMLSCMEERIHDLNSEIEVTCFGQELNPATYAIAKADMMIRGGDPNNMRFGDTLSD
ncbi:hypothetical protein DK853_30535, partial [Klebsiella oxytoca]